MSSSDLTETKMLSLETVSRKSHAERLFAVFIDAPCGPGLTLSLGRSRSSGAVYDKRAGAILLAEGRRRRGDAISPNVVENQ